MQTHKVVVVGGGYAGVNVMKAMHKQFGQRIGKDVELVLLDKNPYHFKKVQLVKAPVRSTHLQVPFSDFGWNDVSFVQGTLTAVSPEDRVLTYTDEAGHPNELKYDRLVLAVGSVPRLQPPSSEGITLGDVKDVERLKSEMDRLTRLAEAAERSTEQDRLLRAVVVGGGLAGVEIAAEFAVYLRRIRKQLQLSTDSSPVTLVHADGRILPEAPQNVTRKLEKELERLGVTIMYNTRALEFRDGVLYTDGSESYQAGICIWALGTMPHPSLQALGLPTHKDGRLVVDPYYRVQGFTSIYAIGDCARIVDAMTGREDGMTCKEAIPQASNLARVIQADMSGHKPSPHTGMPNTFCVSLGPHNGFVWTERWGVDIVLSGKLGRRVREFTWEYASLSK